jgi:serine/threonine-protein kinase
MEMVRMPPSYGGPASVFHRRSRASDERRYHRAVAEERAGTVIAGKYRLEHELGAGGMGSVWAAVQEPLGRPVALKVLHAALTAEAQMVARFKREAELAASIHHPNIVQVTDFGFEDGRAYLVMDRLEGSSLAATLAREGALSEARVRRMALQILDALEAAHARDVVHRDLKPDNIFIVRVSGMELVKLLDFGIASLASRGDEPTMTATGQVLGTPAYMAPEQARGKRVDGRTDLFAVGAILYEALTGRRAFSGENYHELMFAVVEQEPPPIAEVRGDVTPELVAIVERALAKDADARWPSAKEMHAAVAALGELPDAPPSLLEPGTAPATRALEKVRSDAAFAPTVTPLAVGEESPDVVLAATGPPTAGPMGGPTEPAPLRTRARAAARYWWLGVGTLLGLTGMLIGVFGSLRDDDETMAVRDTAGVDRLAPLADAGAGVRAVAAVVPDAALDQTTQPMLPLRPREPAPPVEPVDPLDPLAPVTPDEATSVHEKRAPRDADLTVHCGRDGGEETLVRVRPPMRVSVSSASLPGPEFMRASRAIELVNERAADRVTACYRGRGILRGQAWYLEVDADGTVERAHPFEFCPLEPALVACVSRALTGLRLENGAHTAARYAIGLDSQR